MIVILRQKSLIHSKSNYQPLSLTLILSKVFEKLIKNHIQSLIEIDINCTLNSLANGKSILSNIWESVDIINEYLM